MKKLVKEFTVKFPWGKVAVVSWGNPSNPPILLVHGYMDSAATFIPLVEELPDTYYYVAFDMPGHGKSAAFPPGLLVSQLNMVEIIRGVAEHMNWSSFVYMCHSMGFIIGMYYNHFYPGKITKMIHLDPGPPLAMYYYPHYKPKYWYQYLYDNYYNSYARWLNGSSRKLTRDEAVSLLIQSRSLTEEQAEAILSRSLIPVGDGKFKLSWEARMKKITSVPLSEDTLYTVLAEHTPPMLIIEALENKSIQPGRQFASNILEKCRLMLPNCSIVTVPGGHDVHITNPETIVPYIVDFLNDAEKQKKCKL